jgi:hypothetical protein
MQLLNIINNRLEVLEATLEKDYIRLKDLRGAVRDMLKLKISKNEEVINELYALINKAIA